MTAAAVVTSRFEMGRVVSRTFGVIGRNFVVFALLSLIVAGIPAALTNYFSESRTAGAVYDARLGGAIAGFINLLASCVLQAALIHGTISDLNGRKAALGDCLGTGIRFLLPVLGVSILTGLAVGLGFLLLIVPGVLMGLAWCVNVPVVVVERMGVTATFSRSADLTRGNRWPILGLIIAYVLVAFVIDMVGVVATRGFSAGGLLATGFNPIEWGVLTVVQVVQALIAAAGIASIYYELRTNKEGVSAHQLASVFD